MSKSNAKKAEFRLFYAWQSDCPAATNRTAILVALRTAKKSLQVSRRIPIEIDEATRGQAGSPNIPETIRDKIRASDAFVADITTINNSARKGLRTPNPNVVFELGYAVAQLGWNRIILLFNKEHGTFPDDIPFDFDRHRASPYRLSIKNKKNTDAQRKLAELLTEAIGLIIKLQPPRPIAPSTEAEVRRQRDIDNVRWLMEQVSIATLDEMLDGLPKIQISRVFYFWDSFHAVYRSSQFHIEDRALRTAVENLYKGWAGCIAHDDEYRPSANPAKYVFEHPTDGASRLRLDRAWKETEASCKFLRKSLDALLSILRTRYYEVDIDKCSAAAWKAYVEDNRRTSISAPR